MKEAKGAIWMAGERMEVLIDAGSVQQFETEITARLPYIIGKLCGSLRRRDVARHFIQNIRIGDTVALVDKRSGYAFRLQMQAHSVRVLGIYEYQSYPKEPKQQAVYLLNSSMIWAAAGRKAAA